MHPQQGIFPIPGSNPGPLHCRWLGNAGAWYASAAAMGMAVGQTPAVNSIGVWSNHVVFVTDVSEDGTQVFMKEGGYCGGYNEGWINAMTSRNGQAFIGYIYECLHFGG